MLTVVVWFVLSVLLVTCAAFRLVREDHEGRITTIKEFGHTIRGRFHEVEATGTELAYLLHKLCSFNPMHSSASFA